MASSAEQMALLRQVVQEITEVKNEMRQMKGNMQEMKEDMEKMNENIGHLIRKTPQAWDRGDLSSSLISSDGGPIAVWTQVSFGEKTFAVSCLHATDPAWTVDRTTLALRLPSAIATCAQAVYVRRALLSPDYADSQTADIVFVALSSKIATSSIRLPTGDLKEGVLLAGIGRQSMFEAGHWSYVANTAKTRHFVGCLLLTLAGGEPGFSGTIMCHHVGAEDAWSCAMLTGTAPDALQKGGDHVKRLIAIPLPQEAKFHDEFVQLPVLTSDLAKPPDAQSSNGFVKVQYGGPSLIRVWPSGEEPQTPATGVGRNVKHGVLAALEGGSAPLGSLFFVPVARVGSTVGIEEDEQDEVGLEALQDSP
mmetsp:Transcript_66524/g.124084  ORF Transcript_66524/g.124084 Transcript_66524/m.124084 type:complete len:364 (+) Transcript_66524:59-1150(+)